MWVFSILTYSPTAIEREWIRGLWDWRDRVGLAILLVANSRLIIWSAWIQVILGRKDNSESALSTNKEAISNATMNLISSCCSCYCCFLDLPYWSRKFLWWYAFRNIWYFQLYDCIPGSDLLGRRRRRRSSHRDLQPEKAWILRLSSPSWSSWWAALVPGVRWPRLEWSFWMTRTVSSWGTSRALYERVTSSPCSSLRGRPGGCAETAGGCASCSLFLS